MLPYGDDAMIDAWLDCLLGAELDAAAREERRERETLPAPAWFDAEVES